MGWKFGGSAPPFGEGDAGSPSNTKSPDVLLSWLRPQVPYFPNNFYLWRKMLSLPTFIFVSNIRNTSYHADSSGLDSIYLSYSTGFKLDTLDDIQRWRPAICGKWKLFMYRVELRLVKPSRSAATEIHRVPHQIYGGNSCQVNWFSKLVHS